MGRYWLVEGGGWNLADSVIRCARFLDSKCPKIGRCRAAKNGLSTSFAHMGSCQKRAGYALQIPSSDRIRAQHHAARPARGGANRAQDSEIPQELEELTRKSQTESGALAHKWDRERACRFQDCEAPHAPRFHDFGASSQDSAVPIQNRGRGATPRRSPCSRGREPRPRFQDCARARQNRGRSRGQIPCRLRYSRALHCASRARRACACRCPSGAAARPAQPVRGFSSWRGGKPTLGGMRNVGDSKAMSRMSIPCCCSCACGVGSGCHRAGFARPRCGCEPSRRQLLAFAPRHSRCRA